MEGLRDPMTHLGGAGHGERPPAGPAGDPRTTPLPVVTDRGHLPNPNTFPNQYVGEIGRHPAELSRRPYLDPDWAPERLPRHAPRGRVQPSVVLAAVAMAALAVAVIVGLAML